MTRLLISTKLETVSKEAVFSFSFIYIYIYILVWVTENATNSGLNKRKS